MRKLYNDLIYRHLYIIIYSILTVALVPILWISFFSRPCADDFLYSANMHYVVLENPYNLMSIILEAIKSDIFYYNHWQGLYFSAFIQAFQPSIWGEKYYFIGSWILLITCFLFILYFIKIVLNILFIVSKKQTLIISTFIFCFLFQSMPYPSEGVFWFNAAWAYTLFFFAVWFNMALTFKTLTRNKKLYFVFACVISFLISGGNQVTAFLNILCLFWLSIYVHFYIKQSSNKVFVPFLFAVIGFIIMYLAPGTAVRKDAINDVVDQPGAFNTIIQSIAGSLEYILRWTNLNYILLLFIVAFFCLSYPCKRITFKMPHPLIVCLICYITFVGVLCVPYYVLGSFGGLRVVNIHFWTFEFLSLGFVIYLTLYLREKNIIPFGIKTNTNAIKSFIAIMMIISSLYFSLNQFSFCRTAGGEIKSGLAHSFAKSYDLRLEEMKKVRKDSIYYTSPLPNSGLLNISDITDDLNDFRNVGWYKYYGVKAVIRN